MKPSRLVLMLFVLIVLTLLVELTASSRSSRSSRASTTTRRRTSTLTRRRSTTTRRRASGSTPKKPKITKYTPIPAKTPRSPVIKDQAKVGSRKGITLQRVIIGYMFYRYALSGGPVYRSRYPMHRSHVDVHIPDERAIRVNFTKELLLDSNGTSCITADQNVTLKTDLSKHIVKVSSEVKYGENGGRRVHFDGENTTVTVEKSSLGQSVEISNLVEYNITIAQNTSCTQIKSVMGGTVVQLYATNPDMAANVRGDVVLVSLSSLLFILLCN